MKGKSFHLAATTKTARALRRHLRDCLDCALLAGRVAAIQGTDLEMTS